MRKSLATKQRVSRSKSHLDADGQQALADIRFNIEGDNQVDYEDINNVPKSDYHYPSKGFGINHVISHGRIWEAVPGQWPHHDLLELSLINLANSTDIKVIKFWQVLSANNFQGNFLQDIYSKCIEWGYFQTCYDLPKSKMNAKYQEAMNNIKKLQFQLKNSHDLSFKLNFQMDTFLNRSNKQLDTEDDGFWFRARGKHLQLEQMLETFVEGLNIYILEKDIPSWYPTKLEASSSNVVFLIRVIKMILKPIPKITNSMIAAVVSEMLPNSCVTEEEVRKNLYRKIIAKNVQNLPRK